MNEDVLEDIFETIEEQVKTVINNIETAEDVMTKVYTVNDILTPRVNWKMLKCTNEERKIIRQTIENFVKALNLSACVYISQEKLNDLDVFANATRKGLTKDMNDEQKNIVKKLSKLAKTDNFLLTVNKYATITAALMATVNLVLFTYLKDLYDKTQPMENNIFILVALIFLASYIARTYNLKKIDNNIEKVYSDSAQKTR